MKPKKEKDVVHIEIERYLERGPDRKERADYDKDHPPSTRIHRLEWFGLIAIAALLLWVFW